MASSAPSNHLRVVLQGFRRYLSIRETLCHELAHMVYREHDLNFNRLNSQLLWECRKLSRTSGVRLSESAEGWSLDVPLHPADIMGTSASSSGKTLRQLAGDAALGSPLWSKADPKVLSEPNRHSRMPNKQQRNLTIFWTSKWACLDCVGVPPGDPSSRA